MPPQPEIDLPENNWQKKAQKLLQANLVNLGRKVLAGQPLTAGEVAILAAEAGATPQTAEERPAKSSRAKNKVQLAEALGVSRKTIQRYASHAQAPKPKPNGSLDVEAWRNFLAEHDVLDDPNDLDKSSLQARQILLQNKLLQQKIDQNDRILVRQDDVEKEVSELIDEAKAVLLSGPASLAPQVVGVSVQEAETLLREWLHNALSKLQKNPLGKVEVPLE